MSGPVPFPYDDPAWDTATDAYLKTDTRDLLQELTERWTTETADYLFFSSLLHQSTTYAATFLALPHIVALAETLAPEHRRTATIFLGGVALHGRLPATSAGVSLAKGEPWADTPTGRKAARTFDALMPEIALLCAASYGEEPNPWQASGTAAALGDRGLALWLEQGEPGAARCPACGEIVPAAPRPDETPTEVARLKAELGDIDPETDALLDAYRPNLTCPQCGWTSP